MYRRHTNTLRPPPARRLPPDFAGDAGGFRLSAAGECGVNRFVESVGRTGEML